MLLGSGNSLAGVEPGEHEFDAARSHCGALAGIHFECFRPGGGNSFETVGVLLRRQQIADFDLRYAKQLYGTMMADVSAEQMAAAMALYPMMKQALGKMTAEGGKIDGTPIQTTATLETVKSADQIAEEAKAADSGDKSSTPTGVSGMLGGFAKKMADKKMNSGDANKARATVMTSTNDVLKIVTDVSAADVAVPAGFKEK